MNEVVVGYCHASEVDAAFHDSISALIFTDRDGPRHLAGISSVQGGPVISLLRHRMVRDFLDNFTAPWLLMLDTDMTFDTDVISRFLAVSDPKSRPMVGGLAFTCNRDGEDIHPTLFDRQDDGRYIHREQVPVNTMTKVDATGCACVFIHRSVFQALDDGGPMPFFLEFTVGKNHYGEDIGFCQRVTDAGFGIYVHTGIEFGHMKVHRITKHNYIPNPAPEALVTV